MNPRQLSVAILLLAVSAFAAETDDQRRAAATVKRMDSLAQAIEAAIAKTHAAPDALSSAVANGIPLDDEWGTPFRYVKSGTHAYLIISAGADKKFDQSTWGVDQHTTDYAADAVYAKRDATTPGTFSRIWVNALGAPLAMSTEETKAWAEMQARAEIEMGGSWDTLAARRTATTLFALAVLIERYKSTYGAYPAAKSMTELAQQLLPDNANEIVKTDWWGTEYRYEVSDDRKTYRLVSAGNDKTFDPASWEHAGTNATTDDDAVIRNGVWIRTWDEHTRPGLTDEQRSRLKLKPEARALLEKADALSDAYDGVGALKAYMQAVDIDPAAADLHRLTGFGRIDFTKATKQSIEEAKNLDVEAMRQLLRLRPNDWEIAKRLALSVPLPDAESLIAVFMKARPTDPDTYAVRAEARAKNGRWEESFADYHKAQQLDPKNPERYYAFGVAAYDDVHKNPKLTDEQKLTLIRTGLEALKKAESLKPDYFESMAYRNMLLREQALVEAKTDPDAAAKLVKQADAVRQHAIDMIKQRNAATTQNGPFEVGGDVKAPIVFKRVEAAYPEDARKHGITGIVILQLLVDKSGRVAHVTVTKSVPYGCDDAAVAAVKQWQFQPGTRNGEPVDVLVNVTVRVAPPAAE